LNENRPAVTFEALCAEVSADDPRFSRKQAFGRAGLLLDGKAVMMAEPGGGVVFRLGPDREREGLAVPGSSAWSPMGGRGPRGWVLVPDAAHAEWPRLGRMAVEFVEGLKPRG
jgi:hypothetical protein